MHLLVKDCQPHHVADAHLGASADACTPGDSGAQQLGNSHTRLDAVLMEAIAGPGTGKVHTTSALNVGKLCLGCIGCRAAGTAQRQDRAGS